MSGPTSERPKPPILGAAEAAPTKEGHAAQLRQLSPLLVWAVVFCDIGTSVYYVPGILYDQFGDTAPLFLFAAILGFLLLAAKYVEICWRHPEGGGVVTVATKAFSPRWGLIGGLLICIDYFLTSAISSVSGIQYLGSLFPMFESHVVLCAIASLVVLASINVIGIRESASLSFLMALLALGIDLVVIGVVLVTMGPPQWDQIRENLGLVHSLGPTTFLIGFSGAWLAFSGLESISQLSPAMRLPLRATAGRGMRLVVVTVLMTSPLLTLFAVALLPREIKDVQHESFISELAYAVGDVPLKLAVVATASSLLLFAANTAIIGSYHVFLALVEGGFMPAPIAKRNRRFRTPHVAIVTATVLPILVIFFTAGNLAELGALYAFGLMGAFMLSSLGLDVMRWREKLRGPRFWIGVFTTMIVGVAWFVNLVHKKEATVFGGIMVGIGLLLALGTQQKWFTDMFYGLPFVRRRAQQRIVESEQDLEAETHSEILSLNQAEALTSLYPSHTLLAVRVPNPSLFEEAMARERGFGSKNLYAIYVEERTGLFVSASEWEPNDEGVEALRAAAQHAEREGFTLIPIWTVSHNAVEGIARAAELLGVNGVVIGVSQRTAIYHLLRGHVVHGLSRQLPSHVRLMLVT
jgi:amino acid transporter